MRVLISGAGIAGNALAFWLSKIGHEVTVIEHYPQLRATGLQVDLRGHGVEVMKLMGIEKAFRDKSIEERGVQIVGSSGKRWAFFPTNNTGKGLQSLSTDHEILRGDLCQILYDVAKGTVTYLFGKSIDTLHQRDNEVEVCFKDQTRQTFDLVVGADGQGSKARKEMFKPKTEDKRSYGDLTTTYFTIPRKIQPGEDYIVTLYMATNSRMIMTRRHAPDAMQVYLFCKSAREEIKDVRSRSLEDQKKALASVFRDAGWEMADITDTMLRRTNDLYCDQQAFVQLDTWSRGNVTLVGDAAWATSSNTGMGTTAAMVGAYILAGEIAQHCPKGDKTYLAEALNGYNKRYQPFIRQVQGDLDNGGFKWPSSSWGVTAANVAFGIMSFFRINVFAWLLKEDIQDWDLPVYRELLS